MNFGKYIHELLLENDIVIVPGFGAFVTEYKPAEVNTDNGEMKPPSKMVSFNQQIRNNDGLLVGYVSGKQRVSHFEALKRIEKERENILYNLDSGEKVELKEVGTLFYTEDGKIGFQALEDENLLLDSFGLETTSMESRVEVEEDHVPITPPSIEEEEMEEQKPNNTVEEETEPEPVPVSEPDPISAPEFKEPEKEEKKKKKGWLWLLLILVPLSIVTVYIILSDKGMIGIGNEEVPENTEQITEQAKELVGDTVKIEESKTDSIEQIVPDTATIQESQAEMKSVPATDTPKYYLVGGSFSIEENAETYLKELRDKGFEAFHVGKKGRFFIVGIGTYNTFGEAEQAKKEYMKNNPDSEVWVYKK